MWRIFENTLLEEKHNQHDLCAAAYRALSGVAGCRRMKYLGILQLNQASAASVKRRAEERLKK